MNCKNCGSPLIPGDQICEFCGTPVDGGSTSNGGSGFGFGGNTGSSDPFGTGSTQSAPTQQDFGFDGTSTSGFGDNPQQAAQDYSAMSEEEQKAKLAADFGFGGGASSHTNSNTQQAAQEYSAMSEEEQKAKLAADFGFGGDNKSAGGNTFDFSNDNYAQGDVMGGSDFDYTAGTEHITERVEAARSSRSSNEGLNKIIMYAILGVVGLFIISIVIMVISGAVSSSKQNNSDNSEIVDPVEEPDEPEEPEIEEPEYVEIDESIVDDIISEESVYTDFGIYMRNIKNGYEFGYSENRTFLASAMCQVVILDTLSQELDKKGIDPNYEDFLFTYLPNGKEAPSSPKDDGNYLPLKKFVEDVAIYGDNNKSNHLVEYIAQINNVGNGFDIINNNLRAKGYRNTKINRKTFINPEYVDETVTPNETSPKEIANIYESLINSEVLGGKAYMKNIFKSVSNTGEPIGLKKYVPSYYSVCNVNALNNQSTNNVALISDGDTEIVVAMLSTTEESKTDIEDNEVRERIQARILDYILRTQFED